MNPVICLATQNQRKAAELRALLAPLRYTVKTLGELGIADAPEEDGDSFLQNARIKAKAAMKATGLPSVADDSGLCADALGGAPGIYSARFAGLGSDWERNAHLLRLMEDKALRSARFVCAIVLARPEGGEIVAQGECRGELLREPRGENGFGYDPLFWLPELGKSMAELSAEEKDAISHRGKALRELAAKLGKSRSKRRL